jgi:hypothetical protein
MSRNEVITTFQHEAWYYQPCARDDWIDDLFFFGSQAWDRASVLIVTIERSDQEFRVVDVSSFDEPNAWHTAFADCLQRSKFTP